MAFVSILLPAFYIKETSETEIANFCSVQFEKDKDDFEIKLIDQDKMEYAIRFFQSDLSLPAVEDLIYQRDCIRSLVEKTFESLQTMKDKLVVLEKELRTSSTIKLDQMEESSHSFKDESVLSDNNKLKHLLAVQLENSERFKQNTEKTLNKIKEEFHTIIQELNLLRKQTQKHKTINNPDIQDSSRKEKNRRTNPMSSRETTGNVPKLK